MARLITLLILVLPLCACSSSVWRAIKLGYPSSQSFLDFPARSIRPALNVAKLAYGRQINPQSLIHFLSNGHQQTASLAELEALTDTEALLVLKDQRIIYEHYRLGSQRDSLKGSFSVSKSILSTLIGIAIDEGKIASVDDPVVRYIPEYRGRSLDQLSLKHLLNMSSGIDYCSFGNSFFPMAPLSDDLDTFYGEDLRKTTLNLKAGRLEIGKYYNYNDYYPLIEALILERATGKTLTAYTEEKLWKPLGAEYPATWTLDSISGNFERAHVGLNARAIDFARFGLMVLNHGRWHMQQVVSAKWLEQATKSDSSDQREWLVDQNWKDLGGYYQYHWWGLINKNGTFDYMAHGNLDQMIYIAPAQQIVIVRFGSQPKSSLHWPLIAKGILEITIGEN